MKQAARDVFHATRPVAEERSAKGPMPLDPMLLRHVSGGLPRDTWQLDGGETNTVTDPELPRDTW